VNFVEVNDHSPQEDATRQYNKTKLAYDSQTSLLDDQNFI